jgi:hypothetical protein
MVDRTSLISLAPRSTIRSTFTPRQQRSPSHGRTFAGTPARETSRTSDENGVHQNMHAISFGSNSNRFLPMNG